ncbi:Filamin and NHL repeat containing protein-like protein [Dinothrombium tinctorium]|uniref:Filamin and NHL repeat containing protein-like protein n=1 Tax=Dinothrombium tinctorium TaxID=1965070 RepID=A0A3S4RM36_9ACAR|nr:Filamin and NHL repeat containing protein-like protein [Dinothrombium tinctorium]
MSLPDDNILSLIRNLLLDDNSTIGQQNDLLSNFSFPNEPESSLNTNRPQPGSGLFLPQLDDQLSFLPQNASNETTNNTSFGGFTLSDICKQPSFANHKQDLSENNFVIGSGRNAPRKSANGELPQQTSVKITRDLVSDPFPETPSFSLTSPSTDNFFNSSTFDNFNVDEKSNGPSLSGERLGKVKINGFGWNQAADGAFGNTCNLLVSKPGFQQEKFESQMQLIANEIHSTIQLHMNGLQQRRERLLQQLDHVKNVYLEIFHKHQLGNNNRILSDHPISLPNITFTKPDAALYKAISSLGFLTTPAFAPYCTATGDGLEVAVPGVNTSFTIVTRNCFNEELLIGRENIFVELFAVFGDGIGEPVSHLEPGSSSNGTHESGPDSSNGQMSKTIIPHTLLDHNNGKYTVTYTLPVLRITPRKVIATVTVNGLQLNESPFQIPVQLQHRQFWRKVMSFGTEGNGLGQLCRPWGVAVVHLPRSLLKEQQNDDSAQYSPNSATSGNGNGSLSTKLYLIAVADRSNNRIQLLKYNASVQQISVINVFGSGPGGRPGQFDRPAGISINLSLNHIIVADKDNHRIQVFDLNGRYLFKFGEKGNRVGQFCYPWDISHCPSSHQIVVSDTRNRRVQLFTPYGQYITHFAQPLDSPRGVSFLGDNKIVVSDFNKHRLLIFDKYELKEDPPTAVFVGFGEGSGWGEFLRPQGISVNGNLIFCSDSRNNRICIYNSLTQVYEYLTEDLNLDRPSGLAAIDNLLVIVDFGNNRIQICQR